MQPRPPRKRRDARENLKEIRAVIHSNHAYLTSGMTGINNTPRE